MREETEYKEAARLLAESNDLQAEFAEIKAFIADHPVLTCLEGLPDESRDRIESVLRAEMNKNSTEKLPQLTPWEVRKQFAWAAILVFLLGAMAVISSFIIRQQEELDYQEYLAEAGQPPADKFYQFAGDMAGRGRMPLENRDSDSRQLVGWLADRGAEPFSAPLTLMEKETMGCAYIDGPHGKISLLCFDTEKGTVHLFVTSSKDLQLDGVSAPKATVVNDRNALKWHDEENAYFLIHHEKDRDLPEVFL